MPETRITQRRNACPAIAPTYDPQAMPSPLKEERYGHPEAGVLRQDRRLRKHHEGGRRPPRGPARAEPAGVSPGNGTEAAAPDPQQAGRGAHGGRPYPV